MTTGRRALQLRRRAKAGQALLPANRRVIIGPTSAPISRKTVPWRVRMHNTLRAINAREDCLRFEARAVAPRSEQLLWRPALISASTRRNATCQSQACTAMKSPMTKGQVHESSSTVLTCTRLPAGRQPPTPAGAKAKTKVQAPSAAQESSRRGRRPGRNADHKVEMIEPRLPDQATSPSSGWQLMRKCQRRIAQVVTSATSGNDHRARSAKVWRKASAKRRCEIADRQQQRTTLAQSA